MKGQIKVIEGAYPVTVLEAVKVGDGTDRTLKDVLGSNMYMSKINDISPNIFDKENIEMYGYYDLNNSGAWYDDANSCASSFIPVEPSAKYTRSTTTGIVNTFYDQNFNFINGNRLGSFTTPGNAKFMRMMVKLTTLGTEMVAQGEILPSEYQAYSPTPVYSIPSISFDVELKNGSVTKEKLSPDIGIDPTDNERFEKALPKVPLQIETYYDGANEPYHPSVITIEGGLRGFKYWMAYTPYPDEANENPCIACSNDLIYWQSPTGLTNPIDTPVSGGYWSDTHLVYNPNTKKLECWYRGIGASATGQNNICRKTSSDGINWSEREILFAFDGGSYVSPVVIFEDNKYKIWLCRPSNYYESVGGTNWTLVGPYSFMPKNYNFWHFDIHHTDLGYEMVGMESVGQNTRLIHFISQDGKKFKEDKEILKVMSNNRFGIKGVYRPALFKDNGIYYLFSSINWNNGTNGMGLSIGETLMNLKGITQDDVPYMKPYTVKSKSGFQGQMIFDTTLNKMVFCKRGGRNAVWVDFNGNIVSL